MLPVPDPAVIYQSLAEGAVLFSTRDEVYYGMNQVGARIWEALETSATWEEVYQKLLIQFPDAGDDLLRTDVQQLVEDLMHNHLLLPPAEA